MFSENANFRQFVFSRDISQIFLKNKYNHLLFLKLTKNKTRASDNKLITVHWLASDQGKDNSKKQDTSLWPNQCMQSLLSVDQQNQ